MKNFNHSFFIASLLSLTLFTASTAVAQKKAVNKVQAIKEQLHTLSPEKLLDKITDLSPKDFDTLLSELSIKDMIKLDKSYRTALVNLKTKYTDVKMSEVEKPIIFAQYYNGIQMLEIKAAQKDKKLRDYRTAVLKVLNSAKKDDYSGNECMTKIEAISRKDCSACEGYLSEVGNILIKSPFFVYTPSKNSNANHTETPKKSSHAEKSTQKPKYVYPEQDGSKKGKKNENDTGAAK